MFQHKALALSSFLLATVLAVGLAAAMAAPTATSTAGLKPGDKAPAFSLPGTDGQTYALETYLKQNKTVVVEWFNPDCPWVRRYHDSANTSLKDASSYAEAKGVVWLAVNSGAPGKQGYGLAHNQQARSDYGMQYPVLLDADGKTGMAYGAKTTPTMYIINPKGVVVYVGGVDDTKTDEDKPGANYILTALKQYFSGKAIDPATAPHYGCSIKYAD